MYFQNPVRYLHGHGIFCGVLNCFKNKKVQVSVISSENTWPVSSRLFKIILVEHDRILASAVDKTSLILLLKSLSKVI